MYGTLWKKKKEAPRVCDLCSPCVWPKPGWWARIISTSRYESITSKYPTPYFYPKRYRLASTTDGTTIDTHQQHILTLSLNYSTSSQPVTTGSVPLHYRYRVSLHKQYYLLFGHVRQNTLDTLLWAENRDGLKRQDSASQHITTQDKFFWKFLFLVLIQNLKLKFLTFNFLFFIFTLSPENKHNRRVTTASALSMELEEKLL